METWVSLLVVGGSIAAAAAGYWIAVRLLRRLVRGRGPFLTTLIERIRGPLRLTAAILAVVGALEAPPLSAGLRSLLQRSLLIGVILLIGWATLTALQIWTALYGRRFSLEAADNLLARKHITQVRILERTASGFILVLTVAAALMTIPTVRQYGVTLLASAGAAGIVAGLALQPLLTNLIAGIQIALTQPIRIDDAVIVEGEWGWVEEIGPTYVVVRLWDLRRMILPLSYFIQNPFQNWTREGASLIGTAMIYVDFAAPVERLREKLSEIAAASPLWDGNVVNLAVTDVSERAVQVRCLVSARNAGEAFDLRCEVREKMLAWIRDEAPQALPRERRLEETSRPSA